MKKSFKIAYNFYFVNIFIWTIYYLDLDFCVYRGVFGDGPLNAGRPLSLSRILVFKLHINWWPWRVISS